MLAHLELYCAKRNVSKVVTTSTALLEKLVEREGNAKKNPSLRDYAGSFFTYKNLSIVFISPLEQLFTVNYGKFICQRFISKLVAPEAWRESSAFIWTILVPSNIEAYYESFKSALAIAIDIETFKNPLSIRCISYTAIFYPHTECRYETSSVVLPLTDEWSLAWMRKFNATAPAKVFQNGKYDNSYLLRYNSPVNNWLWDTAHLFHSWYSELPKDLGFLNAFFLRKAIYWKDLAETHDLHEYYRYNAMDSWATANVFIQQIIQMPAWAKKNYVLEFPLVFPCLLAEMTGIKRDQERLIEARKAVDAEEESTLISLRKILKLPGFNPASPPQVKSLLKLLGCQDLDSTGEIDIAKAKFRHPLNAFILDKILTIRGLRKLASLYLRSDDDASSGKDNGGKEFHGRILYSLNPHATDTGRLASREHAFWCGLQIQNIPRGEPGQPSYTKTTICADEGFYLGECDLEQAESRDTAYIAGDPDLITAVSGNRDFHSSNASAFFGVPYESIYDDSTRKTKNKKLRDLAKRVNHGANYNMGPLVLVDTMGLEKIYEAGRLLRIPSIDPKVIAINLLDRFHNHYKLLRGKLTAQNKLYAPHTYYASVAYEVSTTKHLISRAYHHTPYNLSHYKAEDYIEEGDWTRYCFGHPTSNKRDLNSLVAHCPQSLNARTLNEAFLTVFYEIALPNPKTFRLHAQIHDSILFSYAHGHEEHAQAVKKCMEIPLTVRDIAGNYRTFTVPAALKLGRKGVPAKYWSDTE